MPVPYYCPICRQNRSEFQILYQLSQTVHKDPKSGEYVYCSPEVEVVASEGGTPYTVRCGVCGYTGNERVFAKAALKQPS